MGRAFRKALKKYSRQQSENHRMAMAKRNTPEINEIVNLINVNGGIEKT